MGICRVFLFSNLWLKRWQACMNHQVCMLIVQVVCLICLSSLEMINRTAIACNKKGGLLSHLFYRAIIF